MHHRLPWEPRALLAAPALIAASWLAAAPAAAQSEWNLSFDPYVWASAINGDVALGTDVHDVDISFGDILDVLSGAALLHIEARKGDLGLFGDLVFLATEPDTEPGPGGAPSSAEFDTLIVEAGYLRAFAETEFAIELGLRYWDFDLNLFRSGQSPREGQSDWVDGFVGGRRTSSFGDKWTSTVRLNVGGGGSDFSYGLDLIYALALENDNALLVGYKLLAIDRDDTAARGLPLAADQVVQGVTIGFRFD